LRSAPNFLFENDCITTMTDIADTTKTKFSRHNIKTVLDMKMMTASHMSAIMRDKEFKVSEHKLKKWQQAAYQEKEGSVPTHIMKDHRKDMNPYLSRFGPTWKDESCKCTTMAGSIRITKMV
jgi:hypothetical protein